MWQTQYVPVLASLDMAGIQCTSASGLRPGALSMP